MKKTFLTDQTDDTTWYMQTVRIVCVPLCVTHRSGKFLLVFSVDAPQRVDAGAAV